MEHRPEEPFSRAGSLPLVGGMLALDLCNTSSGRGTSRPMEHLRTIDQIVAWLRHAQVLEASDTDELVRRVNADRSTGPELMDRSLALREIVFALGRAMADRQEVPQHRLDEFAEFHARCMGPARLVLRDGMFVWTWKLAEAPVEAALGPIVVSALAILTRTDSHRVKQCHGHECGWLFFDATKNNSRRWCEMEVCGNRAKQKRHLGRRAENMKFGSDPA